MTALTFRRTVRDHYLDELREVPLFRACRPRDYELIGRCADHVAVDAGRVLVREDTRGEEFFVILRGHVAVTRAGVPVATLGPGECFGEVALLDRAPRTATVTALTPLELLVCDRRQFKGLLDSVPALARNLLAVLAHRLRTADFAAGGRGSVEGQVSVEDHG